MINLPSLANSDFLTLRADLDAFVGAGVKAVHVDLMDAHYVPNLCFSVDMVRSLKRNYPDLVIDAHLMVDDMGRYIEDLQAAGCDAASFHIDSTRFARRTVAQIQATGMRAGVAINPSTPIDALAPVMPYLDYVVLMTVEPGFAGQSFLPGSLPRLEQLARLRDQENPDALIQIDGGVTFEKAQACAEAGANALVTGVFTVYEPSLSRADAVKEYDRFMAGVGFPNDHARLAGLKRSDH